MVINMDKELIEQINILAKKQREQGLTDGEKARQSSLRKQYLDEFRSNFRKLLDNIEIVDEEPSHDN